jgi:mono/diheme cytochrome c family protein
MIRPAALLAGLVLAGPAAAQEAPTFHEVGALFRDRCVKCHAGAGAPMGLDLSSYASALSGSFMGPVLVAGDAASPLLQRIRGEATPQMPLDGPPFLSPEEIAMVEAWVMGGLVDGAALAPIPAPRPVPAPGEDVLWPDVEPIFQQRCIKCHSDNSKLEAPPEGLRLSSLDLVLQGGDRLAVLPGNAPMSEIWRRVTGLADPRMPFDGPPWLSEEEIRLIRDWIDQGARNAEGVPAPVPVGAELRLRGVLTAPQEIDGAAFAVDGSTRLDDVPPVGGQAEMRGVVRADGAVLATRFRER